MGALSVGEEVISNKSIVTLNAAEPATLGNAGGDAPVEVLILQGRPIGEPVAQHGPFVMNTDEEIMQAFADYRRTEFGGWPWPKHDVVFPRTKGRFASLNGVEIKPPSARK